MYTKLYHRANEIAMEFPTIDTVAAIDISYSGKMYAESMLPDDWQVFQSKGRILCVSFGNSTPELLFQYNGLINITGGQVIDRDLNIYPIHVFVSDFDYWENITGKFDSDTAYWADYSVTHKAQPKLSTTSIVKNYLTTKPDEFYYADGSPYDGDYHQHGDGQAMTGGKHDEDSVEIYRQDNNGNIVNPRRKTKKRDVIKIVQKKLPPTIIRSRGQSSVPGLRQQEGSDTEGEGTGSTAGGSGGGAGGGSY